MLVPNYRDSLVLEAAKVEGEGNRATVKVRGFDILAFDFTSGRPVPATVLGLPLPADGSIYVLFNRVDGSRTTLDGERFAEFKAFADFVRAEAARIASWALGEGPGEGERGPVDGPNGSGEGSDRAAPLNGLLAAIPGRWK